MLQVKFKFTCDKKRLFTIHVNVYIAGYKHKRKFGRTLLWFGVNFGVKVGVRLG